MGEKLARKILSTFADHDIDTVIPIPETSRTAALLCAQVLNRPYREGFIKNRYTMAWHRIEQYGMAVFLQQCGYVSRYIARTFIMPGQEMRRKTVRLKLNAVKSEFKDKVVLLVDDSIVRGTTSVELIQVREEANLVGG
jgi:amidophosphoribosyltransferase